MDFWGAYRYVFSHDAHFSGRLTVAPFRAFFVASLAATLFAAVVDYIAFGFQTVGPTVVTVGIILLLPTLSAVARRCHDVGLASSFVLVLLIPGIGLIFLLFLAIKPGVAIKNRFLNHPKNETGQSIVPRWADIILIPLICLLLAAIVSALVILAIGESPWDTLKIMVDGALGSPYGWGYTLYYTTSFIFTGLAVTVAFHASLFNIGGEGQAQIGGLGVALVCLALPWPHWSIALVAATAGAAIFGAAWAAIPAYLQAKRGSHIVITTIMFNYIAASLLVYMLVDVLRPPRQMDPATARFPEGTNLPTLNQIPGMP